MKYKVGDKVRIKSLDWYNENKDENGNVNCGEWNFTKWYTPYCGMIMTIRVIWEDDKWTEHWSIDTDGKIYTEDNIYDNIEDFKRDW